MKMETINQNGVKRRHWHRDLRENILFDAGTQPTDEARRMEPVTPWHCVNPDTRRTRVIVWLWCLNEDSLLGEFLLTFTCTYLLMLIWPVRLIFYVYQIPEAEMKQQNASSQYLVMLGGRAEGEIWPKLWAGVSIYLALYSSPKVCVKRLTTF